ncbi:hypothetical protein [Vibrio lentus]|uniref:hypothetical protein n=1 Tax=Vibrio lentus TaxID=136468 RepID=UPI0012FFF6DE|nr:hypothetical protein [Vibrio lentus]MCB5362019.1 hypothetical protein [Vibrio lentus]MCB5452354.1 hypothetical protein [Vibrio lentus]MCB5464387.1 hypothetical protein [Vibrio lentus]MCB5464523.1 hypothetical protein [Vibrio lentus]MCC4794875.1 hypothetical protein [Vibrio lentus]
MERSHHRWHVLNHQSLKNGTKYNANSAASKGLMSHKKTNAPINFPAKGAGCNTNSVN